MTKTPLYITAIIAAALAAIPASCSCSGESCRIDNAAELGNRHAAMLCDTTLPLRELHYRLLNIRALEWQMRDNGYDKAADEYIGAFEAHIRQNAPTLADSIF